MVVFVSLSCLDASIQEVPRLKIQSLHSVLLIEYIQSILQIYAPTFLQLPLYSSTTFNLGSNCRTKLISYSNVRLGGEALRPTTHLTLPITVSSSCNSLNTAAISTLAPNPAAARRHLTKYGKFNYVYR